MNTLTSSGVSAIILSAVSTDGSVPAVRQASEAGIPVICYNTCVSDDAVDQYVTAWVLGDPLKFGGDLGKQAAAYFTRPASRRPRWASSTASSTRSASSATRASPRR